METKRRRPPSCLALFLALLAPPAFAQDETSPEMLAFQDVPVVVGATQWLQRVSEVPASVTVITADELKRYGHLTVADAIRMAPGVHVTDDGQYRGLGFRGIAVPGDFSTRVLVLLDGHTMNERAGWSSTNFDLDQSVEVIDRIEVIQGPGSVVYGTNAFFGVVNIVTRRGGDLPGLAPTAVFGSMGRRQAGLVAGALTSSGAEVLVEGGKAFLDGGSVSFPDLGGSSEADDEDTVEGFVKANYEGFQLLVKFSRREKEIAGAPYGAVFGSHDTFYRDASLATEGSWSTSIGQDHDLRMRLYYDRYRYDDLFDYSPDPFFRDVINADTLGGDLLYTTRVVARNLFAAGLEALYTTTHQGAFERGFLEEGVFVDRDMGLVRFYLQDNWRPTNRLGLWAGMQVNHNTRFDDSIVPRAAIIYDPFASTTLKLVYSEGFRNPSPYEAFFDDGVTIKGNDDATSERIRTLEGIWEQTLGRGFSSRVSVFGNDMSDLLTQVLIELEEEEGEGDGDGVIAPGENTRLQYQNEGDLRTAGVEADLKWAGPRGFQGFANVAYLTDDGEDLPNLPHFLGNVGLSAPLYGDQLYLSGLAHYVGRRPTRDPAVDLDDAVSFDLTLFARRFYRNFEATLGVKNLLDEDMESAGGDEFVPLSIPGEPRSFFGKLLLRF